MSDILTKKLSKNFSIIDNRILQCKELTFCARGLYAYMLSLPDNWKFSVDALANAGNCGVDKIRTILNQLFKLGLLERIITKDERGFNKSEYILYDFDTIRKNPTLENPTLENPTLENPTYLKEINLKRNNIKKRNNKNILRSSSEKSEESTQKKGSRISDSWKPNEDCIQYATEKGLSLAEIVTESERFLNYWLSASGKNAIKMNWNLVWKNWILRCVETKAKHRPMRSEEYLDTWEHNKQFLSSEIGVETEIDINNLPF